MKTETMLDDPLRSLLDDLILEFDYLYTSCVQYRNNAHKKEVAKKPWQRRWAKFRGKNVVGEQRPDEFEDRSFEIKRKLDKLEEFFRDIKSRYLWAQCRLSEQSISWIRNFPVQKAENRLQSLKDAAKENIKFKNPPSEDLLRPFLEEKQLTKDYVKSEVWSPVSSIHSKNFIEIQNGKENEAEHFKERIEKTALLREIKEKNSDIELLKKMLKKKDAEVTQLRTEIRRDKLGFTD